MYGEGQAQRAARGTAGEVLLVFLRLGCTSFGGPAAHLGYFRREFVERRNWCSEATYAELVATANSLPGPASSQVGFALGLQRAGWTGGAAAWLGFTMPSALLMIALAFGHDLWAGPRGAAVFHGLQLVAVAVVAQAVLAMRRTLAPDVVRMLFALAAMLAVLLMPFALINLVVIVVAALLGCFVFRAKAMVHAEPLPATVSRRSAGVAAVVLLVLLVVSIAGLHAVTQPFAVFSAFYRTGAMVFGGGHVVLPLLEQSVVARGWVTQKAFLSGYGAVQAVPGPLFSFAAYLGAAMDNGGGVVSRLLFASAALAGLFAPGLLAMGALLPFRQVLREDRRLRAALLGINASVVGILAAALVHPLWTTTVHSVLDFVIVAAAFALLSVRRVQPWMVVVGAALSALVLPLHAGS